MLALGGCAGGGGSSDGGASSESSESAPTYEFQPEGSEPGQSVTVRIPEDLREVFTEEEEDEEFLVDSYTLTARDLDSADYCAVDLKPDYAKGAVGTLTGTGPDHTEWETDEELLAWQLGIDDAGVPDEELDESDPVAGAYVSQDRKTITVVQDCASAPSDTDKAGTARVLTHDGKGGPGTFAEVEFTVMTDGTVAALGEIADYERDSNGDWIRD